MRALRGYSGAFPGRDCRYCRGPGDRSPQSQRYCCRRRDEGDSQFVLGDRDWRVVRARVDRHGDLVDVVPSAALIVSFVGLGILGALDAQRDA